MKKVNFYIGRLIRRFPTVLWAAVAAHGLRGAYLAICEYVFYSVPWPVRIGKWGVIRTRVELTNYVDNFLLNELRCAEVEAGIASDAGKPVIIDLGVNTGVTVRWWYSLNSACEVIGVDMIEETLDYTNQVLKDRPPTGKWIPICVVVGARKEPEVEIAFDSPLEGTSSMLNRSGSKRRKVRVDTLDNLLAPLGVTRVKLLKCDIEGFGGFALQGATDTLKITDFIVTETHDAAETKLISRTLSLAGFVVFRVFGKMLWWCRDDSVSSMPGSPSA